jgi:hypothetical protein
MMALIRARDAAEKALQAAVTAIEYHGSTYATEDAKSMLQDVISQLNGEIKALRPERPIYAKDVAR